MSDLEPIQRSRLGEIGQLLAKAREEKGLTLEEVSGKTLIRATILRAIEEGDDRPLPEPVYIRGFIRRFGDLVGLNGMELCDSFPWQPSGSVPLSFVSAGNNTAAPGPAIQQPVEAAAPAQPEPEMELEIELEIEPSLTETMAAPLLGLDSAGALAENSAGEAAAMDGADDIAADAPWAESAGADDLPMPGDVEVSEPDAAELGAPDFLGAGAIDNEPEPEAPQARVLDGPEPVVEPVSVVESVMPNHEAAYESRAALFGDDDAEQFDGAALAGGTAALAATTPSLTNPSVTSQSVTKPSVTEAAATAAMGNETSVASPAATEAGVATLPPPPAPVMYREPEQLNVMPWLLGVVAAALGLGIAVLAFGGGDRQTAPTATNDPAPVEQVETASNGAAAPDASEGEATAPTAAVPADKVVLELEVRGSEEAWMDVLVDGELQIEGNQVPGFKQRWEGSQEIELATARPDMVWISVNGSAPQPFGKFEEAQPVKIGGFKPANAQ